MGYGYQPKFKAQLNGSATESEDCGVMATTMGIDMMTKGVKQVGRDVIRDRMNKESGGVNMWDIDNCIETFDTPDELGHQYAELNARRETDGGSDATWETVTDWLPREGGKNNTKGVILGVDYGMLRRSNPNKTGSDSFDGWHSILLTAYDNRDDMWQVRVYDSLVDGRDGQPGPGPQWIQAHDVKQAAWSYGKAVHGKAERIAGVFLKPAVPLDDEPEPEPPDPCAAAAQEAAYALSESAAEMQELAATHPEAAAALRAMAERIKVGLLERRGWSGDPAAEPGAGLLATRSD